jgi:hypothetical protein
MANHAVVVSAIYFVLPCLATGLLIRLNSKLHGHLTVLTFQLHSKELSI